MRRRRSVSRSTYSILLIASLLTAGLATTTIHPVTAEQTDWETLETDHFVIEYQSGYKDDAERIGHMTETARAELLAEMPGDVAPTLDEPIHIRVYPGDKWQRSEYTLFWKNTDPVRIHVQAPSDAERVGTDWYEGGLAHEFANIILWDDARDHADYNYWQRNPGWYPEGISEYYVHRTPTVSDQFPGRGVQQMNESIRSGEADFSVVSESQYYGGHLLAMYMIDAYGEDAIWQVLRDDRKFYDSVEAHFGVTQNEFEREWYTWADEHIGGNYSAEQQTQREAPDPATETVERHTKNEETAELRSDRQARNTNPQYTQPAQTRGVALSPTVLFGLIGGFSALSGTVGYLVGRVRK